MLLADGGLNPFFCELTCLQMGSPLGLMDLAKPVLVKLCQFLRRKPITELDCVCLEAPAFQALRLAWCLICWTLFVICLHLLIFL